MFDINSPPFYDSIDVFKHRKISHYFMLKSMTAYGRACVVSSVGRFVVEIQSVNRKHLEINVVLPKELLRFDPEIKKWVALTVFRGQVNVRVTVCFQGISPVVVTPNLPLVKQIKGAWDKIAEELGVEKERGFSLDLLVHESGILLYDENLHDEHLYRQALQESMDVALRELMAMKRREGEILRLDILARLEKLIQWGKEIAAKAPGATKRYRQKLMERLEEVVSGNIENEERILREVSIFAERIDITEESIRFDAHLTQLALLFNEDKQSVGKTVEFLVQELNREVNTISSKSSDIEVSHVVVEIKTELERIREQIQNIE